MKKIIKNFREDAALQKLMRQSAVLLQGQAITALLGVAAVAIAARGLGPEIYGGFILVVTFTTIIDRIGNVQSWQALIKFGSEALAEKNNDLFGRLMGFGLLLDIIMAGLRVAIAIAIAPFAANWFGWDEVTTSWAMAYSIILLFGVNGMPTAILRMNGRVKTLAYAQTAGSAIKLVLVAILFLSGATVDFYLIAWAAGEIISQLWLSFAGIAAIKASHGWGWHMMSWQNPEKNFHGWWKFLGSTCAATMLRSGTRELDIAIIGAYMGPASAGFYHLVRQIGNVIVRAVDPLNQALYPDLARLAGEKNHQQFWRMFSHSAALAAGIGFAAWIGALLFGEWALGFGLGENYRAAYGLLCWYMFGVFLAMAIFLMQPAVLALGGAGIFLRTVAAATLFYLLILAPAVKFMGLEGAGLAYICYCLVWGGMMFAGLRKLYSASR